MASDVDLANMALGHLGSEPVVTSLNPPDGTVEAGYVKRYLAIARQQALEMCTFAWTKKRAILAEVDNPSDVWTYAYARPADCLIPLRVLQVTQVRQTTWPFSPIVNEDDVRIFTERGSAEFEIEGTSILTHEPEAVLLYKRDITDLTKTSSTFVGALSYLLASYLAGPIIKGSEGANTAQKLKQIARDMLATAATIDANASAERGDHIPEHMRGR